MAAKTAPHNCDVLILGAGVVGLSVGIAILEAKPNTKVIIAEKENALALHARGRNAIYGNLIGF